MTHRVRLTWVCIIYFMEGLPFGVFADALPVYFRLHGLSLTDIGFMASLQLPWSLKVFWGPLVDRLGSPRQWIFAALCILACVHAGLAFYDAAGNTTLGAGLAALLLLLTITSATQDIAIDGYFVRFIGADEEGLGNGLRVGAYRAALIVGGGGTLMLSTALGWTTIFAGVALLFAGLALLIPFAPPVPKPAAQPWGDWLASLWRWMSHPGAPGVFAFILLYKLGDASMAAMIKPFWVDRGMDLAEIGLINTTVGIGMTIAGALAGGWYTSRFGIYRALWVLGLGQAVSNLGYAAVAHWDVGKWGLYGASVFENFTSGLGTAAQLALLTRICDREHASTQFAALTGMFGLTRALTGIASGVGADHWGFANYFALTFALSLPAYAFLPYVKVRLRTMAFI